jgi:hypothetical protein
MLASATNVRVEDAWLGSHEGQWFSALKSPGSVMSVLTLEWDEGELDEERGVESWLEQQASMAKTPRAVALRRSNSLRLAVSGLTIDTTEPEAPNCAGDGRTPPSFWGSMVRLLGDFVGSPAAASRQQCRGASKPEADELEDTAGVSPCSTGTPPKRRFDAAFGLEWTSSVAAKEPPQVGLPQPQPQPQGKQEPERELEQEEAARTHDQVDLELVVQPRELQAGKRAARVPIRSWSSDASDEQNTSGTDSVPPNAELDLNEDENDLGLKDAAWFLEVLEAANERELELLDPAALAALQQSGLRTKTKHRDAILFHEDVRFVQHHHAFRLDYSDAKCKKDPCKWLVHGLSQAVLAAYPETLRAKPDRSCVWSALLERAEFLMRKSGFTDVHVGFSKGTGRELTFYLGDYAISRSNFTKVMKRYADDTKL